MVSIFGILLEFLTPRLKRALCISFIFSIICSFFDLIAISSLIPFIAYLNNSELETSDFIFLNLLPKVFNENSHFYTTGVLFAISVFIASIIKIAFFRYNTLLTAKIGNHLSNLLFGGYLSKDYEYHVNQNSNKFITVISTQLDNTVKSIGLLLQLFLAIISCLFFITFLISLNAKYTILSFAFLISFYLIIIFNFRDKLGKYGESIRLLRQDQIKTARETIDGIRDIIINQYNDYYTNYFKKIDFGFRRRIANTEFIGLFPKSALEGFVISILVIVLLILKKSGININLVFIGGAAYALQKLLPTFQMIYYSWSGIKSNEAKINEIRTCLKEYQKFSIQIPKSGKTNFNNFKNIELLNISYTYKTRKERTLKDCNMKINRGETIGIIGKTGSGKSTLTDIIMGLLITKKGSFLIDGKLINGEFNNYFLLEWRKCIAHVPQEVYLKNDTILANILELNPQKNNYEKYKLEQVLEVANINQFLPFLEKGLQTFVGDGGVRLSGGQKQRIGIAKALMRQKPILFLDEGTSSLDATTEKEIIQKIKKNFPKTTIIMITHNKLNLSYCDRVFKVSSGNVKELEKPFINKKN